VWVTDFDWTELGPEADTLAHFIGSRAFMRMRDGHCTALRITRPAGAPPEFYCTIYERRPQICRELGRGSPECVGELETKSAAVSRAVRQANAQSMEQEGRGEREGPTPESS
jgi:Fe-S-cluster containining protein